MSEANTWRPIIAALANETTLQVFARIVVGASPDEATGALSPSRRAHVLSALQKAGLLDDRLGLNTGRFADALAANASDPRPTGVARYLDADGRVLVYPSRPEARSELLRHLADRAFVAGEVLEEPEVNERLRAFTGDVALLRRYLVDDGILERTRSGSAYTLTPGTAISDSV